MRAPVVIRHVPAGHTDVEYGRQPPRVGDVEWRGCEPWEVTSVASSENGRVNVTLRHVGQTAEPGPGAA
jgi:hypothetical protein